MTGMISLLIQQIPFPLTKSVPFIQEHKAGNHDRETITYQVNATPKQVIERSLVTQLFNVNNAAISIWIISRISLDLKKKKICNMFVYI